MSLRKRVLQIVEQNNIKLTHSSRGGKHIRFPLDCDYVAFFNQYNIDCTPLYPSISGTFESFTLLSDNESIIWVNNCVGLNTSVGKIFNTKDLTPDNLGISGIIVNYDSVVENLKKKYDTITHTPLIEMLEKVDCKDNDISIDKLPFNDKDLATISKDYGEILSSIWVLKKFNFDKIEFPTKSNEKMVDFYGYRYGVKYPISVKSGNGSKVNLQNIIDLTLSQSKDMTTIESEIALKVIKTVNDLSVKDSIIELHKQFNTEGIKELSNLLNVPVKDITTQHITKFIQNHTVNELKTILNPLFNSLNTKLKESTWDKTDDKMRFIISPLGENIWKVMNNDVELRESLCRLANKITLLQVNIDVKSDKIIFDSNKFKDSKFEFNWAGYSSGNKLGFKMTKGKK